jgi:TorA maturation chaperone TorD
VELLRALAVLTEEPRSETARLAGLLGLDGPPTPAEYARLFGLQLYPYASVYLGAEGMLGGEARDRIAGFWRALGLTPPAEPDHLATLLAGYANLAESPPARAAFLWEHLLSWLPAYLDKLRGLAGPAYAGWADRLREVLAADARVLPAPPRLPLHLREAPALPGENDGRDTWVAALLAPVRCGMILTRTDLGRAAADLGLGLRAGERRFALAALLDQRAPDVLAWLAREADAWRAAHAAWQPVTGDVARWWAGRAEKMGEALRDGQLS